jgi:DNA-binding phage protein
MNNTDHLSLEEWIEFAKYEFDDDYEAIADRMKLDFTEDLLGYMLELGMSKADLAEKMGCSRAYMTKVLAGDTNMTIETMVKMATAVGLQLHIRLNRPARNARHSGRTSVR